MGDTQQPVEETKDKKDSELPSPAVDGERSPLPRFRNESGESSPSTLYDAVGIGLPPPPRTHPIRMGSAFYAETPAILEPPNRFDESFAAGREDETDDARGELLRKPSRERISRGGVVGRKRNRAGPFAWWFQWMEQIAKLFTPQWRLTVILMWIIWATMSFGESRAHLHHCV